MKKLYPLLCLLLWSVTSFAQNQSPVLKKIFTTPDSSTIIDYRYKKTFSYKQNGAAYTYYLSNVSNGASTVIPFTKRLAGQNDSAWVTRFGVVFIGQSLNNDASWSLYEWAPGTLNVLAENMGNVHVAGDYVMWSVADTVTSGNTIVMRKNLATQQQIVVADTIVGQGDIGPNGNIAYTNEQAVYLCTDSICTEIAHVDTTNLWRLPYFFSVHTDGVKVTYEEWWREAPLQYGTSFFLYENGTTTKLYENNWGDFQLGGFQDLLTPLFNNGYIAGQIMDLSFYYNFRTRIYSRDPQGTIHYLQDTYTQTPLWALASVEVLTPQGDVGGFTYGHPSLNTTVRYFYYINHDGSKRRLLSATGNGIYYEEQDSTWLITDHSGLYAANLDTVYDHHIVPFTKQAYTRNRAPIPASDFVQHYSGPATGLGQIQQIEITGYPKHGVLVNKYGQPIQTNNNIILRSDLDTLKYSAGSFPGTDTIRWRAYDGLEWTKDTFLYIKIAPALDTIKPFERTTLAGTPIRFWGSNFKLNYTGKLAGIRVNRLPVYGKLTIGGKQLVYERSAEVTLAELDSMYYTPNPNIVGIDTLQWMGFNGTEYTKNDTPAILRIYPILNTPPILRTLESTYSTSGGADTILIANYPAPRWHTDVLVVSDNNRVLPIAPDNTFIIDPATYSVGTHTLKVGFKHKLDSISIQRSFTITSPFAPMMMAAEKYGATREGGPISAWPNPFSQQFTLTGLSASGTYILTLVDQQGKTILQQRIVHQNRVVLNLDANAGNGVYLLKIFNENKKDDVKTLKLLHL
ncbi:Por secretion system C-terminal sorting domain-containing protein [Chitinophaga rupis]|uniref:Por secretion system C-terminal sorting domain-containing protein n=1 Tax=Chitinophaga rupis TaxID=573321 RepID=A0A1H7S611_9BACT|nr:T9SS type A sorting domain-containing protein [Chitinophaga rupis]SEL67933.1 Por secretion system C-terminal sorting domain-containing protein [Chitinophaga rupis]